ncbi:response regulator transcription factor [Olivibacter sp. CPCC 100613]|uniref:response regulator transcription factor n=1 Tax=Olivibacter sp. CPCC 100613 TaxID=3079931 RepID=UPI002FFBF3DD
MINIILVDDHHIVRQGITSLLELESDLTVIGETDEQTEMNKLLQDNPIDIVMLDINMPGTDGITLTKDIKRQFPATKVIILTMMDHEKYVAQAFEAGANAYLIKNVSRDELLFAIRFVTQDEQYICSEITMKLLKQAIKTLPVSATAHDLNINAREMEVLALTADGFTNQEIAERLYTSKRTVEGHRQSLIEKTGVRNTAALIKYAFQTGLLN